MRQEWVKRDPYFLRSLMSNPAFREAFYCHYEGCEQDATYTKRALGEAAHLMVIGSLRADGEHVVCLYRGWYYDGNGIHRRDELLNQLTYDYDLPSPYLHPLTRAFIATTDIPAPDTVTDHLEAIFRRAFALAR